jgi:hypothetical protein
VGRLFSARLWASAEHDTQDQARSNNQTGDRDRVFDHGAPPLPGLPLTLETQAARTELRPDRCQNG